MKETVQLSPVPYKAKVTGIKIIIATLITEMDKIKIGRLKLLNNGIKLKF